MGINENKLKALHKKFDMAEDAVNQMNTVVESLEENLDDLALVDVDELSEPGAHLTKASEFEEVFTLDLLKGDFMLMRSNLLSVISRGQRILEDVGCIDIGDMKASQLDALANLQKATGENIKLLMDVYKSIIDVEKNKYVLIRGINQENLGTSQGQINVSPGASVTQNVIVAGSTHDILQLMKEAEENKPKEIQEIQDQ